MPTEKIQLSLFDSGTTLRAVDKIKALEERAKKRYDQALVSYLEENGDGTKQVKDATGGQAKPKTSTENRYREGFFFKITSGLQLTDKERRQVNSLLRMRHRQQLLQKLRKLKRSKREYPKDYPILYTSEKQRRFVNALLQGKPYVPKNHLNNLWDINVDERNGNIGLNISNKAQYHPFVVGTFGDGRSSSSIRRYLEPMQQFHLRGGWNPVYAEIQKEIDEARKSVKYLLNRIRKK